MGDQFGGLDLPLGVEAFNIMCLKRGFEPFILEGSNCTTVQIRREHEKGSLEHYFVSVAEVRPGEMAMLFSAYIGKPDQERISMLAWLCNQIHDNIRSLGTVFYSSSNDDEVEDVICYRHVFPVGDDDAETMSLVTRIFDDMDEFYRDLRWACLELVTSGTVSQAIDYLSVGHTLGPSQ